MKVLSFRFKKICKLKKYINVKTFFFYVEGELKKNFFSFSKKKKNIHTS